jgi:hypothetical protein
LRVHYRRLEEYLAKVYRLIPEYAVSPTLPPSQDAHDRADAIRSGRRSRDVALILDVLCLDGFIPAGRHIIDTRPETPPIRPVSRALLRQTGTPESEECIAFRDAHREDRAFTRPAGEIDRAVPNALGEQ